MRPVYERETDRAAQATVAAQVAAAWRCEMVEMPRLSCVDYAAVVSGSLVAIVEVKRRPAVRRSQYDSYLLSDAKAVEIERIARALRVHALLVVSWADACGWCNLSDAEYHARSGGRVDRGDALDIERCRHIPITAFRAVPAARAVVGVAS